MKLSRHKQLNLLLLFLLLNTSNMLSSLTMLRAKLQNIATLLASNSCSKLPYDMLLKDARWLSTRLEILRRDDFTC